MISCAVDDVISYPPPPPALLSTFQRFCKVIHAVIVTLSLSLYIIILCVRAIVRQFENVIGLIVLIDLF